MWPEAGAGQTIVFLTTVLAKNVDFPMVFGDFVENVTFPVFPQQHSRGCALAHRSRGKKCSFSLGFRTGILADGGNLVVLSVIILSVYLPVYIRKRCFSKGFPRFRGKRYVFGVGFFLGTAAKARNVLVL